MTESFGSQFLYIKSYIKFEISFVQGFKSRLFFRLQFRRAVYVTTTKQANAFVAHAGNGVDSPSAAHFRELSLAPWAFTCEGMELWRALAGVAASAMFLHCVWPVRGPIALGGKLVRIGML